VDEDEDRCPIGQNSNKKDLEFEEPPHAEDTSEMVEKE
jgi:hypothetical protein